MFKPESWQSHNKYRTIVNTFGRSLSRNNPRYHFDLYSKEQQKLLALNLDPVRDYIARFYSGTGRPAKNQAQILRSLILFVLLFNKTPARTSPHLMDGFAMSFPIPFPLLSSAVFPLFLSFLLSALIMTS